MKKLTVISGKGGTGKTTVVSNFAALADNLVLADCDVDAPNMHLLLKPEVQQEKIFKSAKLAVKDEEKCTDCGLCQKVCKFGAITSEFEVDRFKCDGCGVCVAMCPQDALELVDQVTGNIFISESEFGPMIHARLKPGADNSGKLVSEVREIASNTADENNKNLVLIDGSPGIGCPVIASLNGVDAALIVTEPTKSGLSDLKRILKVTEHFSIKTMVLTNKYDLNEKMTNNIEKYCEDNNIHVLGKIPYEAVINESLREGQLVLKYADQSKSALAIREVWDRINSML